MKTFEEIILEANNENWCVQPHCTTCGAMKLREALCGLNIQEKGLVKAL